MQEHSDRDEPESMNKHVDKQTQPRQIWKQNIRSDKLQIETTFFDEQQIIKQTDDLENVPH